MAKKKKKWRTDLVFEMFGLSVTFDGREPKKVDDPRLEAGLLSIGTFEKLPSGRLKFKGRVRARMDDGTEIDVDQNGEIELDFEAMEPAERARHEKEFKDMG